MSSESQTPDPADRLLHLVVQTRAGGAVERCHGVKHLGSYSNAAHQWGVAALLYHLFPRDFERLVGCVLFHDVGEFIWGDVPAPTMRYLGDVRAQVGEAEARTLADLELPCADGLEGRDFAIFKACDRLELYLWCQEQFCLGNRFVMEIVKELEAYLDETNLPAPADAFYRRLRSGSMEKVVPLHAGVAKQVSEELSRDRS